MPDDGQQLNTSLFSNSRPYCYLDREEVNAVRSIGLLVVVMRWVTGTRDYCGNDIWVLLIPATRGHSIQSRM